MGMPSKETHILSDPDSLLWIKVISLIKGTLVNGIAKPGNFGQIRCSWRFENKMIARTIGLDLIE
jgi:hypothetical protein